MSISIAYSNVEMVPKVVTSLEKHQFTFQLLLETFC